MAKGNKKKTMRRGRRGTRKANRRTSRRCWSGGAAPLNDTSMAAAGRQSLAQGGDYLSLHKGQHGGAAVSLSAAAPVGYTGMLDDALRATARITPLDHSISAIQGMRDQSGGGRKRRGGSKKHRAAGKKLMKKIMTLRKKLNKLMKKATRHAQRGGAALVPADYGSPGMLLSPMDEAKAMMGMNPEWKLAADPAAFAPKMA